MKLNKEQAIADGILISAGFTFSHIRQNGPRKLRVYSHSSDMEEVWVGSRGEWHKWTGYAGGMKTVSAAGGQLWTMEGHFAHYLQGVVQPPSQAALGRRRIGDKAHELYASHPARLV